MGGKAFPDDELDLVLEAGIASKFLFLYFPEEIPLLVNDTGGFGECLELFKYSRVLQVRIIQII